MTKIALSESAPASAFASSSRQTLSSPLWQIAADPSRSAMRLVEFAERKSNGRTNLFRYLFR